MNKINSNPNKKETHNKTLKNVLIISASILILVCIVYGIYTYTIIPTLGYNITINNIDCSLLTPDEGQDIIMQDYYSNMDFKIIDTFTNTVYPVSYSDFDFSDATKAQDYYDKQSNYFWFTQLLNPRSYDTGDGDAINKLISSISSSIDILDNSTRTPPENAYVAYNNSTNVFDIIPETAGSLIDSDLFSEALKSNILNNPKGTNLEIDQSFLIPADHLSTDPGLINLQSQLNSLHNYDLEFHIRSFTETLELSDYVDLIEIDNENFTYNLDLTDYLTTFVDDMYHNYYTLGIPRSFTTTSGSTITISGGNWGSWLDQDATLEAILDHFSKSPTDDLSMDLIWVQADDLETTSFTNYVEVDLTNQHLYVYKDNTLVLQSDIVSGDYPNHITPAGIYRLTYKTKNQTLRGPGYASFVNYWMPFNYGIGFHDATWRSYFGGSIYKTNGSHGCINMPLANAKTLYEYIDQSYAIICYWR